MREKAAGGGRYTRSACTAPSTASRPTAARASCSTVLVHAALIVGPQMARRLPPLPATTDRPGIQWIWLPAPRATAPRHAPTPTPTPAPSHARERERAGPVRARPRSLLPAALPSPSPSSALPVASPVPAPSPATVPAAPPAAASAATSTSAPAPAAVRSAGQILEQARRDIGKIDKALRKENLPTITAPPDSPQIRLRKGVELA